MQKHDAPTPQNAKLDRRHYLKTCAAIGSAMLLPASSLGKDGQLPPSERVSIAFVGAGGQGRVLLNQLIDQCGQNNVAMADVDENQARRSFDKYQGVPKFQDFRRMLDELGNQIDAVAIATPDHMHFAPAMAATQMGKHVFLEKPLTRTIWETRQLVKAAAKYRVATQMGNYGHSMPGLYQCREWIEAGVIGNVTKVDVWSSRGGAAPKQWPLPEEPVPSTLNWDLWLGAARERPYNSAYLPGRWRHFWDFGSGPLGDIGCHTLDAPMYALQLGYPKMVRAKAEQVTTYSVARSSVVTYEFPRPGDELPVTITWYDGGNKPTRPEQLEPERELAQEGGALFYGTKGVLYAMGMKPASVRLLPESRMREFSENLPAEKYGRIEEGHYMNWINAVKGGPPACSHFGVAGFLTEVVNLGNLAIRTGSEIAWDAAAAQVTNVPEANEFVKPYVRPGWEFLL